MDNVSKQKELNYGIELLRIVSMMMIVTLHVLGRGGVLEESVVGGWTISCSIFYGDSVLLCC